MTAPPAVSRRRRAITHYWPKVKLLYEQAREFHRCDWMLGTSGNLSVKVSDDPLTIAVTASGRDKGSLTAHDIVLVNDRCELVGPRRTTRAPTAKPSAETAIHLALYRRLHDCGAVFHVHTLYATALTSRLPEGAGRHAFEVARLEMLKGFNIWEQHPSVTLPVFPNWLDIDRLSRDIDTYVTRPPRVPALLIAHHGLTAWGRDAAEAEKHTELTEFICRYLWTIDAQPVVRH